MPEGFEDEPRALIDAGDAAQAYKTVNYIKSIQSQLFYGLSVASVGLNVFAIVLYINVHTLVIVGAVIAIAIAPFVVYQQCQMEDIDTLRTVQNEIRNNVNQFAQENQELETRCQNLKEENDELKATKDSLAQLAQEQGSDIEELVALVEENRKLVMKEARIIKQDLTQSIIQILMDVDRNRDSNISEREINRLVSRLSTEKKRVKVNETLLVTKVKADPSFRNLILLTNDLERIDVPDEDRVFTMVTKHKKKMKKMAAIAGGAVKHMKDSGSGGGADVEAPAEE